MSREPWVERAINWWMENVFLWLILGVMVASPIFLAVMTAVLVAKVLS